MCLEQPSLCSAVPSCVAEPAFLTGVRLEGRAAQALGAAANAEFLMLRCSEILRLALKGMVPVLLLLSYCLVPPRKCEVSLVLLLPGKAGSAVLGVSDVGMLWPRWQEQSPSREGNPRTKSHCLTQAPRLWQSLHRGAWAGWH